MATDYDCAWYAMDVTFQIQKATNGFVLIANERRWICHSLKALQTMVTKGLDEKYAKPKKVAKKRVKK